MKKKKKKSGLAVSASTFAAATPGSRFTGTKKVNRISRQRQNCLPFVFCSFFIVVFFAAINICNRNMSHVRLKTKFQLNKREAENEAAT